MSSAREAAEALAAYDPEVARHVLTLAVSELGGPELGDPADLDRARGFLTSPESRDPTRPELSTREWKVGFARRERLRAFALELAKQL